MVMDMDSSEYCIGRKLCQFQVDQLSSTHPVGAASLEGQLEVVLGLAFALDLAGGVSARVHGVDDAVEGFSEGHVNHHRSWRWFEC